MREESGDLFLMAADLPSGSSQEGGNGDDSTDGVLDGSGDLFVMAADSPSDSSQEGGNGEESGDLFVMAADLPSDSSEEAGEDFDRVAESNVGGVASRLRDGPPASPTAPGNHNRTDAEIWASRCSMPAIEDALRDGCNCGCISRFQHGAVFEQRRLNARRSVKERKKVLMQTLKFFSTASGSMRFKSHDGQPCCRKGWTKEQGHLESYVSRGIESLMEGNLCADPNNGGKSLFA